MKIIEAQRDGEVSYVRTTHNKVTIDIFRVGSVVSIEQSGLGNARLAKQQAKTVHRLLWA